MASSGDSRHSVHSRRALRRAVALAVGFLAWVAIAGVGGPLVGKLSEVQSNDNASFLPSSAESTTVNEISLRFRGTDALPYFVVLERRAGLTRADRSFAAALARRVDALDIPYDTDAAGTSRTVPVSEYLAPGRVVPVPSEDGEAVLVVVSLDGTRSADALLPDGESVIYGVAEGLRAAAKDGAPAGLTSHVTGPGGILADFVIAFSGIDGRLLGVALITVFVILLLVYRSPVLPFAVLLTSLFGLSAAALAVYPLAKQGVITVNGQAQGILFILVVGAATDYSLLLVARYREELHEHSSKYHAMRLAWRGAVEPIAASAATVILGLLCLLFSDLGSTKGLGPVGALGIAGALLAGLSFLPVLLLAPAILLVLLIGGVGFAAGAAAGGPAIGGAAAGVAVLAFAVLAVQRRRLLRRVPARHGTLPWFCRPPSGRWLFWPRIPRLDHVHAVDSVGAGGLWGRVSALVGRHPRRVWLATAVGLAALSAFLPGFAASGVSQTDTFRDRVDSVVGQEVLAAHFPAGSGSPAIIVAPQADGARARQVAATVPGVAAVTPTPTSQSDPSPKVVDGKIELEATLTPAADSPAAEEVVRVLRDRLDGVGSDVLVGGNTAINYDVRQSSNRDLRVIIPIILAVILVVLALLLRSLLAPVLLILANVLSFGATIGASALVFTHVLDLPGGDPAIPLYGFVFLVALGIDYSIFLMTRVREESIERGTRPGILVALAVTGGVITSAGVVLAATFGALATLPILFLLQIAFIVAFGVLLDTLIVRSLLVPALAYDIGPRIWWPNRLSRAAGG